MGRSGWELIVCEDSVLEKMVSGSSQDSVPFSRAAVDGLLLGVACIQEGAGASRVQFRLRFLIRGFSISSGLAGRLAAIVIDLR